VGSLKPEEAGVLALLRGRLARETEQSKVEPTKNSNARQRVGAALAPLPGGA